MAVIQPGKGRGGEPCALLVEGSPSIHRPLGQRLRDQGVVLMTVDSVQSAREVLEGRAFGVVVVDLVLADGSGLEVLDAVRASDSAAHVIVMSGSADNRDRTAAYERGANDYVVKPCLLRELASRVVAVGRWADPEVDALLTVGRLTIDLRARQVRDGRRTLDLTGKEFDLLAFLAARPGHVFSRTELLRAVWQSTPDWQQAATVTEHIRRLRAKIETDPRHPQILRTVRGSGYRLDLPATDAPDGDRGATFERGTIIHVGGRIVHADQAAGVLLGPTPEARLVGRQIFELAAPTSQRAIRERVAVSGPGSSRRTQLIDLERTDGTEVSVEVASEQTNWEGQPAEQVTLTHVPDLSARLRRLVTGVLGEVTDAVIITDLHFHLRSWNQAAERLYGWREHEVLGRHLLDVLQPLDDVDNDEALAATWENLETTGRWKGQSRHLARDGWAIDVLSSTSLIRDHSGEPILIVAVNRPAPSVTSAQEMAATDDEQIRMGLANDAFVVHYQPIVDLSDDQVVAMEALVRWDHPDRGMLTPAAFIAAAERSGAIIELGDVVFEKACAQAAEWQRAGKNLILSVNISARQLAEPSLYDRIIAVLTATGLDPHHLWLEVTETALIEDVDRANVVLHRLTELGIGITIDDFGTGWASLTYLRSFPIHALKIDRSFVAGVGWNASDTAIVRSILTLGAELGLVVVAEGIETRAQQRALQELGCTIGQGFLHGRPGPASGAPADQAGGSAPTVADSLSPPPTARSNGGGAPPVLPTLASITRVSASSLLTAPHPMPSSPGRSIAVESDMVADLLRGLLRIRSAPAAVDLLHRTIRDMGGTIVPAAEADEHALPVDVSLGEGPPAVVEVERFTVAHMQLERLLPRMVEDARQAVDLLRQTERLVDETSRDELTGLANRRALDGALSGATSGSVVMIGLDHVEDLDDQHGHAAGDVVLVSFAMVLTTHVPAQGTSCRVGSEEFALVLSNVDASGAVELVDRIRTTWSAAAPRPVTFSAGVADVDADGGMAALLAADRALHEAKALGCDRTELAAPRVDREEQ
ncbi:MAG: EAL domain-containing protein [Acidimicrobiales bacterium]|nr:EAL domain-containing protein [Acidimicrobiales bacterium]